MVCGLIILGAGIPWMVRPWPVTAVSLSMAEWRNKMEDLEWGETVEGLGISISVEKPIFKTGEAVFLDMMTKNFDKDPVPVVIRSTWLDYDIKVFSGKGGEIPKSPYAVQMIESAAEGRRALGELEPGAVLNDRLELTRAYDLATPGTYTVIVTRTAFQKQSRDQFAVARSNELTIEIIP